MKKKTTENKELREYIDRFKNVPPEKILRHLGKMRDFLYKYMTPEGRKFFEKSRSKRK